MKSLFGVLGAGSIAEGNKNKEENKMFNKRTESFVGVVGSEIKNEEENKMKKLFGNVFGRKGNEVTKNKEETKMLDKFCVVAAHAQAVAHGAKLVGRALKEEVKSGYYQGVENSKAEVTSEAVVEKETTVETEVKSSFQEFAATLGTVINAPVEEASEELVEAHVELTKEFEPEVVKEISESVEELGGITEEEVSKQVDAYLRTLSKVSLETGAPSGFMKFGRLTGFLAGKVAKKAVETFDKVKEVFSGTGEKLKEVMKRYDDFIDKNSYANIFFDTTKSFVAWTLGFTFSAWGINLLGLGALAGWVAVPAVYLIVAYPFGILAVSYSKFVSVVESL